MTLRVSRSIVETSVRERPLTRAQIFWRIGRWEPRLRRLGSQWSDGLPAIVRRELLDVANAMLRIIEDEAPDQERRKRRMRMRRMRMRRMRMRRMMIMNPES